jgi:hypothetical protein
MTRFAEVARCVQPPTRRHCHQAGRGAYAIRALPDLRVGIVSERLENSDALGFSMRTNSKPRHARGFLSISAGTEPGGKCGVGQLVTTRPASRVVASPGPSLTRRAGALTDAFADCRIFGSVARGKEKAPPKRGQAYQGKVCGRSRSLGSSAARQFRTRGLVPQRKSPAGRGGFPFACFEERPAENPATGDDIVAGLPAPGCPGGSILGGRRGNAPGDYAFRSQFTRARRPRGGAVGRVDLSRSFIVSIKIMMI